MSRFEVKIKRLVIHEHPNADALELAQVDGYRAVVGKGAYETGDYALYIPEQAVLPPELIEELGLTGRLAGGEKDRVKAVRLRGELSQGIVCRPKAIGVPWGGEWFSPEGEIMNYDFATELGITKWVPPVPVGLAGDVRPAPDLMPWVDIENIKSFPDMFEPGEMVVATEKIHGSCCLVTHVVSYEGDEERRELFVTSKGVGAKKLSIKESDGNLYWRAVRRYRLGAIAELLADELGAERVGLFGEVYGSRVQDLHYGADASRDEGIGYALFDVSYDKGDGEVHWADPGLMAAWRLGGFLPVPEVPILYFGPYDAAELFTLAEGNESISGAGLHLREGLVVRPVRERRGPEGRVIAKFVSEAYLTRKNGTEYE